MKKIYFIMFACFLLIAINSGCVNTSKEEYEKPKPINQNVSVWVGKELTLEASPFILDIRTQDEYNTGHIKDAVLIPLQEMDNMERLNNIPKDKHILVYSSDGQNSTLASEILIKNGFMKVYNMEDGIGAWIDAGFEVVK